MANKRYCLKCGAELPEVSEYCGRCGYPARIHLIDEPPKLRITYKLGIVIFLLGLLSHLFVNYGVAFLNPNLPENTLYMLVYADEALFLPLTLFGALTIISAYAKLSLRPWIIDIVVVFGFLCFVLTLYIIFGYLPKSTYIYAHFRTASYILTIGGILCRKMIDREVNILNMQIDDTKFSYSLAMLTILLSISYLSSLPLAVILSSLSAGIITWIIWDTYTPRITRIYIFKNWRGEKGEWMEVVQIGDKMNWRELRPHYTNLLLKSFTPILMAFSLLTFADEILPLGLEISTIEGMAKSIKYSLGLIMVFSIFVSSTQWLFDVLDLRIFDKRENVLEKVGIISYLDSFIDVFALIGFLITLYNVAAREVEGATGVAAVYYSISSTVFVLFLYWITLLATSLTATLLYFKFSIRKHVNKVLREIGPIQKYG